MTRILPVSFLGSCYSRTTPHELNCSIESILLSSHAPAEILLVVDGPVAKDLSSLIARLQILYTSLKVINLENNVGLGNALKAGLEQCTYDIVFRFDTDDICCSDRLFVQYNYLLFNPEVSCCGSDVYEFRLYQSNLYSRLKSVPRVHLYFNSLIRNPLNHPSVAFRKCDVFAAGGYMDCNYFEDYFLWIRMLVQGFKVRNLECLPLVCMDRPSFNSRRSGVAYFFDELSFAVSVLMYGFAAFPFVLPALVRAFLRFTLSSFVSSTPWRASWSIVDDDYLSNFLPRDRDRVLARFLK